MDIINKTTFKNDSLETYIFMSFVKNIFSTIVLTTNKLYRFVALVVHFCVKISTSINNLFCNNILNVSEKGDVLEQNETFMECKEASKTMKDKKENFKSNLDKSITTVEPKYSKYSDAAIRLLSFESWPFSLTSLVKHIIDAGFFYTKLGDRVICFYCGVGLKDWSKQDDPWVEHAIWFPECVFLVENKGQEFINHVQKMKPMLIKKRDEKQISSEITTNNDQNIKAIRHKFDLNEITNLCKNCNERNLERVLMPCGHLATCNNCIRELENCPICGKNILAHIKAHLA